MTTEQIVKQIEDLVSKKYDKTRIHELLIKLINSCYNESACPKTETSGIANITFVDCAPGFKCTIKQ